MKFRGRTILKKTILFAWILFLFAPVASSNSSPVRWFEHPTSVVLSLEDQTPIAVLEENLIFDFSQWENAGFGFEGQVTASYIMENTDPESVLCSMVFPVIGSLWDQWPDLVSIEADGRPIPVEVLYGQAVGSDDDSYEQLRIEDILVPFQEKNKNWVHLSQGKRVYDYTFQVDGTNEALDLLVTFHKDENLPVVVFGFNSMSYADDGTVTLTRRFGGDQVQPKIDSLGSPLVFSDIRFVPVTDGTWKKSKAPGMPEEKLQSMEDFIKEIFHFNERTDLQGPNADKNKDMLAWELEQRIQEGNTLLTDGDISAVEEQDRFLLLRYDVAFKERQKQEIRVSYPVKGSMDRSRTVQPVYTYRYLLKPAEHWKYFENLNIRVIPPTEAPYMIEDNMRFERQLDGIYEASSASLPDENLSFSLYAKERITLLDRIQGLIHQNLYAWIFFGAVFLLLTGLYGIVRLLVKGRGSGNR